ncbi:unnamed protein product [Camellia sinensis]
MFVGKSETIDEFEEEDAFGDIVVQRSMQNTADQPSNPILQFADTKSDVNSIGFVWIDLGLIQIPVTSRI